MNQLAHVESERRDTVQVVRVCGEVDISNSTEIAEAIEAAVPNEVFEVAIDLTETTYLDSAGLSLLVRLAQRLETRRQRLRVVVPLDSPVRAVLEISGLPEVIGVTAAL
jgi:anti-sigma B factor antagonist